VIIVIGLILALVGGSGQPRRTSVAHRAKRAKARATPTLKSVSAAQIGTLPAAIEDPAVASLPDGRVVLLGGIDSAQASTDGVGILQGGSVTLHGTLTTPQHDAQAATLGSSVYVFGGGQLSSYDHILRYDPGSGATSQVGTLPSPASDVAVASIDNTAYVIGGYTGTSFLNTIVAWTPNGNARVVAHLPFGLRYAAVATAAGRILIAGGTRTDGLSAAILSFDPSTGSVSSLGSLRVPITHSSAVFLDGRVVLVGGRRQLGGDQTRAILAVDPATGSVRAVGQLPRPLSDAGVSLTGGRIVVAGGDDGTGPQSAILALTPTS
jgi:Kelch motif protein